MRYRKLFRGKRFSRKGNFRKRGSRRIKTYAPSRGGIRL